MFLLIGQFGMTLAPTPHYRPTPERVGDSGEWGIRFKNPGKRMVGGCALNIYDPRRSPHCANGERGLLKQAPRNAPTGAGEGMEE